MRTVGIFGGSFSPVHTGHTGVALGVLGQGLADEVWLMPCRRNPLKDGAGLMDDAGRLALLEKAKEYCREESGDRLRICDVELSMPLPSYTADTLRRLREENPDCRFRLICGADSYLSFQKWKEWQWLEAEFSPIVYPRPGYEIRGMRPGWTMLEGVRETDISSSRLREASAGKENLSEYMPWLRESR